MADIIYKGLCYSLNGVCYAVQNKLGSACSEKQYQDALELCLKSAGLRYEREKDLLFRLEGGTVSGNKADFVVDGRVVVDTKAKKYITRSDYTQMLRYLKAGGYKLGLIVNFGSRQVTIKRVVNSDFRDSQQN